MNLRRFTAFTAMIFLMELALPPLLGWQLPIFPAFAIFFILQSADRRQAGLRVLTAGLLFDSFSGLPFGLYSIILLTVIISILAASRWLTMERRSRSALLTYGLIFFTEWFVLVSYLIR